MSSMRPVSGQRWVSDTEPELGLGIIATVEGGRVVVDFPASSERRVYAIQSSPLRRVAFREKDRIKLQSGEECVVDAVRERAGLLHYQTASGEVAEGQLSAKISFSKPDDRLFSGALDEARTFDLRVEALRQRLAIQQSPCRGYVGGRVDLIPHQLSITGEVSSRLVPRVLLADEVGLGKTIEAGLILHRLHLTGIAGRVLVLVPEPLVHQWFLELMRRFNLMFSIFDEERCESLGGQNPFLDSQLIICSVALLAENPARAAQACEAGWDLLVVDEAHHLEWSPEDVSVEYALVEALSAQTPGLLLLTATPQQLGPEGHFARLRLLDPDRYSDLSTFLEESNHFSEVAAAVNRIVEKKPLTKRQMAFFGSHSPRIRRHWEQWESGDDAARERLITDLLDSFGTGRVMFRNTRAALSGFPERKALLVPLSVKADEDPVLVRIKWLAGLLKSLGKAKVLLICRTKALAEEIHEELQRHTSATTALFHEGLTLLQRDRNAAFFAEEEGARMLICSEIGSEGRNFQFAHHLVLFDLPTNPEVLEQRIGRLDRIGQTARIQIHVPYETGTETEVLARWYHEGLHAFEHNVHGAAEIARVLADDVQALRKTFDAGKLRDLILRSREEGKRVVKKLESGYDRLLALSSCQPVKAAQLAEQISRADADREFEKFVIRLMDYFGVTIEEMSARSYLFRPGHLLTDGLPSLPQEGLIATFDRENALKRDDISFLTADHPLVRSALDLLLGSEAGNTAYGIWRKPGAEVMLLEAYLVVECVAPAALHVDRFLAPTPLRVLVDHTLKDLSAEPPIRAMQLEKGDIFKLLDSPVVRGKLIPAMLEHVKKLAEIQMREVIQNAASAVTVRMQEEIERLEDLREINSHVRPSELDALRDQREALLSAISSACLRLDALRLIYRTPAK